MQRRFRILIIGATFLMGLPPAHAQIYKVTLSGQNEIPPAATTGTGSGIVTLNSVMHEMRVIESFSGLVGATTASHIHCCAVQPVNAGVATTTPTFPGFPVGVTSGSMNRTYDMSLATTWNAPFLTANGTPAGAEAAMIAGLAAGRAYLNVHTAAFPGGELRGFFVLNVFAANTALTQGARNAATVLDSLGAGTGVLSDALVSLASMAAAPQAAALENATPSPSRGVRLVTSEMVNTTFDQASARLDGYRLAGSSRLGALPDQGDNGVWATINGVNSIQGQSGGFAGYRNNGYGLAGGYDRQLQPDLNIGAAVSYSRASLAYRGQSIGDSADIRSTQLSLYGSQDLGRVYLDGMAAYGWQKYKSTRNGGVTGTAAGAYSGQLWGVRVGGGMPFAVLSNALITPQAHLDWNSVKQDAYRETSGGPLALAVAAKTADRFQSSLGAQVDFAADTAVFKGRPYLRATWHHEFKNDGLDTSASFVSGGASFVTPGQKLDGDTVTVGVGLNFYARNAFSAALTYDGTLGKSYQSQVLAARARWTF